MWVYFQNGAQVPKHCHQILGKKGGELKPEAEGPRQQVCSFSKFFLLFRSALQHMEVPRLGVQLELQLLAYTTATPDLSGA